MKNKSWCDIAVNYLEKQESISNVTSMWGKRIGISGALSREQILELAEIIKMEGKQ
jgi:hypothetical protein